MPLSLVEALDRYGKGSPLHDFERTEHAGTSYQEKVLLPFIERLKKTVQSPLILDLASGKGEASDILQAHGCQVVKLDISEIALRANPERSVKALMKQLPFGEGVFDAIHCKDGAVHTDDFNTFLRECKRVLKPKGRFLMITTEINDKVFFAERGDTEVASDKYFFRDLNHYRKQIEVFSMLVTEEGEPVFSSFSPPYFPVYYEQVVVEAARLKYKIQFLGTWKPSKDEPDWHDEPEERLIFELRRQVNT